MIRGFGIPCLESRNIYTSALAFKCSIILSKIAKQLSPRTFLINEVLIPCLMMVVRLDTLFDKERLNCILINVVFYNIFF